MASMYAKKYNNLVWVTGERRSETSREIVMRVVGKNGNPRDIPVVKVHIAAHRHSDTPKGLHSLQIPQWLAYQLKVRYADT